LGEQVVAGLIGSQGNRGLSDAALDMLLQESQTRHADLLRAIQAQPQIRT
jgi:hypothetical protein